MVDLGNYENYPSCKFGDNSLSYGSGEDEDSTSEIDQTELEVALYSQIHFEHNPTLDITDPQVSQVVVEEEVPEEPDENDLNWRERLLGGLNKPVTRSEKAPEKEQVVSTVLAEKEPPEKKNAKKKLKGKNVVTEEKSVKKKEEKKKEKSDSEAISKLLYRDEPENKLMALEMKGSRNKASTPKGRPPRVVIVSQDSDDSEFEEGAAQEKRIDLNDFIVIDSVSDSESDMLGGEDNPITIDSDMNISRIKRYSESEKKVEEVDLCTSSDEWSDADDDSDDDDSDDDDNALFSGAANENTDIQINYSGFKSPLGRPAKNISLVDVNLEDISDLTVEDIHKSLGECDWSLVSQDKHSGAKSLTNRYFKELNVKCHNCQERGHLSKICPKPKKVPTCLMCGLEGHLFRSCPNPVCFNCFHVGHRREACEWARRRPFTRCNRCLTQGHDSKECTDLWRQYHMTTQTGPLNKVKETKNERSFCYNCAEEGHFGHECEVDLMDRYKIPQWPFIARYQLQATSAEYQETPSTSGSAAMTKTQRRKEKKIRKKMERKIEKATKQYPTEKKQNKVKQTPFIKNAQKSQATNDGRNTRNTKKRTTQNEKFEAEYQNMVNRGRGNPRRQNTRPQKRKNTRYGLEAQHAGDFQRSKRPYQEYEQSQSSYHSPRGMGRKRKRGNETTSHGAQGQWDHTPRGKRARYSGNMDHQQGPGISRKKRQKTQFTSDRGFRSYI